LQAVLSMAMPPNSPLKTDSMLSFNPVKPLRFFLRLMVLSPTNGEPT